MLKSDVLHLYGTSSAIADILSISSSAVSQWGHIIPEKQAYRLERKSNGILKVNPKLYQKSQTPA